MTAQTPDMQAVLERLEKLERQNRRLKRVGLLVLVAVSAVVLMGQAAPKNHTVEAEEFVVKDSSGKRRASFGMVAKDIASLLVYESGGRITTLGPTGLVVVDSTGSQLVELVAGDDGSSLTLGRAVRLGASKGSPGLSLYDETGKRRGAIELQNGGPSLDFGDATGKLRATFALFGDGPRLWLLDDKQKERFAMGVNPNGPHLTMSDDRGFQTTIGSTDLVTPYTGESHKTSAASLVMFDKEKNVIWRAP
jgi:hypothetical protein